MKPRPHVLTSGRVESGVVAVRRAYPRKVEIARAVEAAKACGIDVAGIEISPDGHIRLTEARAIPMPQNDFDRWQDKL